MLAARAVAVVDKSVVNATAPLIIETPLTVSVSIDPAAPVAKVMVPVAEVEEPVKVAVPVAEVEAPVKVAVPVAAIATGVLELMTELFLVASIVKRSTVEAPAE